MLKKPPTKSNLYFTHPSIAKEWHPAKNEGLTPKEPTLNYNRKVWWLCSNDHVWAATINERIYGTCCPYCSNKIVDDENIPQALNPSLAKEWHPTKNENLKVWWLCSNGHEWLATVNERINGNDCSYCSEKAKDEKKQQALDTSQAEELHPTKNESLTPKDVTAQSGKKVSLEKCLQAVNPNLAKEWHPTKNGSLTPKDVTASSHNQVWWLCSNGHEWKAAILSRSKGQGCFYCSYMQRGKRQ